MRTIVLLVLAASAVGLVWWVAPPERPATGLYAVRGPRLVKVPRHAIRSLSVTIGQRRVAATSTPTGWQVDGVAAPKPMADALEDLARALVNLRAVDAFRAPDQVEFGLRDPGAVVDVVTAHRTHHLVLGSFTHNGAAIYARRDRDPRTFLVGSYLLSQLRRAAEPPQ